MPFKDLGGGVTVWSCSRAPREPLPLCEVCKIHEHTTTCSYRLRGAKLGQLCGRKLCASCAILVDGAAMCPPHGRLQAKST